MAKTMASSNVKNMSRTKAMGVGVKNSPAVFNGVPAQSQLNQKWLLNRTNTTAFYADKNLVCEDPLPQMCESFHHLA